MSKKVKIILVAVVVLLAALYYYIALPAVNIHASGFWFFLIVVVLIGLVVYILRAYNPRRKNARGAFPGFALLRTDPVVKIGLLLAVGIVVVFLIGSLLSSKIINAEKYQKLLTVENGVFQEDIKQVTYSQIPLLDEASAKILGNRTMGSLVDLTSQFVVSETYTQINYQNKPVRVAPLEYASIIKWFTNHGEGIPAYIKIDMTTQNTELVRLPEGMKYTPSDHFGRNLERHLRFNYPTYIFDQISFEIDDEGTPWWVCGVKKFNIGLFGGQTIGKVVLCNAITGDCESYDITECPEWVDRVYSAQLLMELYDYYGTLKHGFFNSVFSQRDCLQTTNGYNYLALNDDVWVYTGVTSITSDQSNVGFVLMNQRTMESKYYQIEGAIEDSAMSSAEGQVQHLGYQATFPLLLNIKGEPTYFLALKDDAGLVKKYAMMNVRKYQNVAIGDTVNQCEKNYIALLKENGIKTSADSESMDKVTGRITTLFTAVVEGDTHIYLILDTTEQIYDVPVSDYIDIIRYKEGDEITLEYLPGDDVYSVIGLGETTE